MGMEKLDYLKKALNRRNFHGLMDLYDENYILLKRLIPDLDSMPVQAESRVEDSPTLYLIIEERNKYTTTVSITYFFEASDGERTANPDLHVRIYHDARQAEVLSCGRIGSIPIGILGFMGSSVLDYKWESNLFLEKWLKYSIVQGHLFSSRNIVKSVRSELDDIAIEFV